MPRGLPPRCSARSLGANIFMVGYAYQLGALPLSADAIEQAIALNGEAVAMNHRGVPLGPPRGARSRRGRGAGEARGRAARRQPPAVAVVRGDGRAARRIPHRLSERGLCRALPRPGREGEGRGGRQGARQVRARRGGRALSVQADGLQGRVRGGAALHRRHVPEAGGATSSAATTCASNSISRRRCSRASIRRPASRAR